MEKERYEIIKRQDPELYEQIRNEENRQKHNIELIASENFVSEAVLETCGRKYFNK